MPKLPVLTGSGFDIVCEEVEPGTFALALGVFEYVEFVDELPEEFPPLMLEDIDGATGDEVPGVDVVVFKTLEGAITGKGLLATKVPEEGL